MDSISANSTTGVVQHQVLPTSIVPNHYNLELTPNIETSIFDGNAIINISFKESTDNIVLNTNEIELYNVSLKLSNGETVYLQAKDISYDTKLTQATLSLPNEIPTGSGGELRLSFHGKLTDQMNGFYRASYKGEDDTEKFIASTHFEAPHARKAFPCWDEPNYKATFNISLKVYKNLTALSNMDVIEENDIDGTYKLVKFATSPKISTYLIAFTIGDLDYIEKYSSNNIKCRVYAPRGQSVKGKFALDFATKALDLYDSTFDIKYPLPKMDMVAIPDFSVGGMENWGLVSYSAISLLLEESSSIALKQGTAKLVAHELAHQWFGNLVTMEWWSDLWLNEGFATWVTSYAINKIFPEWDFWTNFVAGELQGALNRDSLRSSHPIQVEVSNADEAVEVFDSISYDKGASVIHMLYSHLGEESFFKGIRTYLKKFSYGNAKTGDLWQVMDSVSKQNITGFMFSWINQVGYPYLEIKEDGDKLLVEQRRFLLSGDVTSEDDQNLWWISLGFVSGNSTSEIILNERSKIVDKPISFYKFNKNSLGPYRVHYSKEAIARMAPFFYNENIFTTRDRISVVSDIGALSQSGIGEVTDILNSLHLFKNEENGIVLRLISSQLSFMQSVFFESPSIVVDGFNAINQKLFSPIVKRLGWEFKPDESVFDSTLRTLAIVNAGTNGDSDVILEAQSRFTRFVNGDNSTIHHDLLNSIFKILIISGNKTTFDLIKREYVNTNSSLLKGVYSSALGHVNSPDLVSDVLNFALTDRVRHQDVSYIFSSLGDNPKARRVTWEFIQANWPTLEQSYPNSIGYLVGVAGMLSSQKDYQSVEKFFSSKDTTKYQRSLAKAKEKILSNTAFLKRGKASVEEWFSARQKTDV